MEKIGKFMNENDSLEPCLTWLTDSFWVSEGVEMEIDNDSVRVSDTKSRRQP